MGRKSDFQKELFNCQGTNETLALGGLPARFLSIQYYIGRQKAIVTIDKKTIFFAVLVCAIFYTI